MKYIFLFSAFFSFLFSVCNSEQISTEKFSAQRFICPLKGKLAFQRKDLVANGKEKLKLIRYYNPQASAPDKNLGDESWSFLAHTKLRVQKTPSGLLLYITQENGDILKYCKNPTDNRYSLMIDGPQCNFDGDIPSGSHDARNASLTVKKEGAHIIYVTSSGIKRVYKTRSIQTKQSSFVLLLEEEFLLNGNTISYEYDDNENLISIKSFDPTGNHIYSSISLEHLDNHIKINSSSNTQACYYYETKEKRQKKSNQEKITITSYPLLTTVTSPYRKKEMLDYTKDFTLHALAGNRHPFQAIYSGDEKKQRVRSLLTQDNDFTYSPTCNLEYEPAIFGTKAGKTTISHSDGTKTIYYYNKDLLLVKEDQISQENVCLTSKNLTWNKKNYLESVKLTQGTEKLLFEIVYEYDQFGNPITESFYGNFNGNNERDCQVTKKEFSQDGRHLLQKVEQDNGYIEEYTYFKNTNLVTCKYVKFFDRIVQRNFFEYDKSHNCILEILDDGSSYNKDDTTNVTTRQRSFYTYKKNDPFKHMMIEAEHQVMDGKEYKHSFSKQLFYDKYGNITKENTLDKNYHLAYTINKEYDESSNLISETNPNGKVSTRPLRKEVEPKELLKTIDFETNNALEINAISSISSTGTVNNCGVIATQTLNAFGNPIENEFANGSLEKFIYNKDGTLRRKIGRNGLETYFEYDPMGRITLEEKRYNGDLIDQKTYTFNAFYLLSETHNGVETTYTYTPFGKLESQMSLGKTIYFSYDDLNKLSGIRISNNGLDRCSNIKQNLLNETIELSQFSRGGSHITNTYTYDETGKLSEVCFRKDLEAVNLKFESEAAGISKHIDANGVITTHGNEYNDETKCLKIFKIDGKNTKTIKTIDSQNNRSTIEVLSADNITLQKQELFYDNKQNLTKKENYFFQNGICTQVQSFTYEYDLNRNCIAFYREKGTMQERKYTYTYDACDRVISRTYPNDITLYMSYTPLGNLATLKSSDNSIFYEYKYDIHQKLIEAIDHISQKTTRFERDVFGNITLQTDENNFTVQKEYDGFNRPTKVILPDASWIENIYDSFHLKHVTRFSNQLIKLYTHSLSNFNLHGMAQHHNLGYDLGTKNLQFDNKGNLKSANSPFFTEENSFDPLSNRIAVEENQMPRTFVYDANSILQEEITKTGKHLYTVNSINFENTICNDLNELLSHCNNKYHYDLNGNLITKQTPDSTVQYTYDALNRLVQVSFSSKKLHFTYDALGRRTSQTLSTPFWYTTKIEKEFYVYDELEEIGSYTVDKKPIAIKIQAHEKGKSYPIGIELNSRCYIPILDTNYNIRGLVDPTNKKQVCHYTYSAYGDMVDIQEVVFNPFRFKSCRWNEVMSTYQLCGKDYLPETNRTLSPCEKEIILGENQYHLK